MSEDSYLLEPKEKKAKTPYEWFMLLLKIFFFFVAFVLVAVTVLANMGGTGDVWHEGVRQFIREVAGGRPTKLEKLNEMSFFPTVRVDFEDAYIYAKKDDEVPLISVGKLRLGMPFLNVATRAPRITDFYIEEVSALKGVFMPNEFTLEKLFIDHDQESKQATLRLNGKIGLQSWSMEAALEAQKGITGKNTYILAPKAAFALDFADVHIKGIYNHASLKHLKIEDFELRAGEKSITGDILVSALGGRLIKVKGGLDIGEGRTMITPDLILDLSHKDGAPSKISGEITSEKMLIGDVLGKESIFGIITRLRELMGYTGEFKQEDNTPGFLGKHDLNLHVFLKNVEAGRSAYESLSFDILREPGRLRISTVTGKDDQELMPTLVLLQKEREDNNLSFIMQDGALDVGLLRPWLKNLPAELSGKQPILVSCGIGALYDDEGTWAIDKTSAFSLADNQKLGTIDFPKDQYDFVKASLQKSGKGSPCEEYILLKEPEE